MGYTLNAVGSIWKLLILSLVSIIVLVNVYHIIDFQRRKYSKGKEIYNYLTMPEIDYKSSDNMKLEMKSMTTSQAPTQSYMDYMEDIKKEDKLSNIESKKTTIGLETNIEHITRKRNKLSENSLKDKPRERAGLDEYTQMINSLLPENNRDINSTGYYNTSMYSYKVKLAGNEDGSIRFTIFETRKGRLTKGGSSFSAEMTPRRYYHIIDHYNGTYTGICDPIELAMCSDIVILLQSVRYLVYQQMVNPLNKVIGNDTICYSSIPSEKQLHEYRRNRLITWSVGDNTETRITHHFGVAVPHIMNHSTICKRLSERYDHVTMLGASHSRYQFDYILEYCFPELAAKELTRKHNEFDTGTVNYFPCAQCYQYPIKVKNQIAQYKYTSKSLAIMQVGAHDLYNIPMNDSYLAIPMFLEALVAMCKSGIGKVMVLGTPPFPDLAKVVKKRVYRNSWNIPAFNYEVESNVMRLQKTYSHLEYFNVFDALKIWQDKDVRVCGGHYMCRIPGKGVFGDVGLRMFRFIMTKLLS